MTASEATPAPTTKQPPASWGETLAVYLQPRVLIVLFLGLSCGLPLALSASTLLLWMREAGVDLGTIGLFALVGTPYTIKFLWAPAIDALNVPLLTRALGRRRGWLVFSQILLIAAILLLALTDPAKSPFYVALGAVLVATASATQDTVVDAFRVESLPANEQAAGMAAYVAAYRIGMLISAGLAPLLVTGFVMLGIDTPAAWMWGYVAMAAMVGIGMIASLLATEPKASSEAMEQTSGANPATRTINAAFTAFSDFLTREHVWAVLAFVILFKFTDAFSGTMTAPFVIDLGYTRADYATIVKGVGLTATIVGGFAGGFLARAWSLPACLWFAGIIQALSNLVFAWLATVGVNQWALAAAITAENFTGAIGTVIFVAYLSSLCNNPLHTATQYALLAAMSAVGRTYLSAGAGFVAQATGWPVFFAVSVLVAIPSLLLLAWLQRRDHFAKLQIKA
jgi:PAT family beta-lactamase induction signal transducer AmpG